MSQYTPRPVDARGWWLSPAAERLLKEIDALDDRELTDLLVILQERYGLHFRHGEGEPERPWDDDGGGFTATQRRLLAFLHDKGRVKEADVIRVLWGGEGVPTARERARLRTLEKDTKRRLGTLKGPWSLDRPEGGCLQLRMN